MSQTDKSGSASMRIERLKALLTYMLKKYATIYIPNLVQGTVSKVRKVYHILTALLKEVQ